ncbi:MAG: DUF4331 domain-containing protein [Gammaproteobacteria bacterium]|nr:DUF4331 domain-containing protein [Gammaproteobacteria bacterium]
MNLNTLYAAAFALFYGSFLVGCSSNDDDDGTVDMTGAEFEFAVDPPESYTRVDRTGMPAIATALIASKDAYNAANPTDDIAGSYVPEIVASLEFLHTALDDQLTSLGLTPCTVMSDGSGSCVAFAAPLIIPDTVKLDTNSAAGFPNGRLLADPVIDITLAVALLELTGTPAPHTPADLVGVLNPPSNDKEFSAEFPYLAAPH